MCNDSSSNNVIQREPQCHCPRESRSRPKDAVFLNTGQFHLMPALLSLFAPVAAHSWAQAQDLKFWTLWKSSTSAVSGTVSHLPGISLPAQTRLFPAVESNSEKAALASRLLLFKNFPPFLLVAPVQSWAVVVLFPVLVVFLIVCGPAQSGLVGILIIHLAAVFDRSQPGLHIVEF